MTIYLGYGPVPAKILHAGTCVTLGEGLKDAMSVLLSYHFLQRIDNDSLHCIGNIVKNTSIIKQFAHPIITRRSGPCEPLTLATPAALCNSLRELAIEKAKPRHHRIVSGNDDNFLDCRAQGLDQSCSSACMLPFLGTNLQVTQGPCLV
jgi:hypothetical protein